MRNHLPILAVLLALVAGCPSSSDPEPVPGLLQVPPFVADIDASRVSGSVDGTFSFQGVVFGNSEPIDDWSWDFGDGDAGSGIAVQHAFEDAGFYPVVLTATDRRGDAVTASLLVSVYAEMPTAGIGGFPFPPLVGDANDDGELDLADAHLILRHARGLAAIQSEERLLAADVDLDGEIREGDALLLAEALAAGARVPRRISPAKGPPGTGVNLISPALLDPEALVEVQVGDLSPMVPFRPALGYASLLIPFDAAPQLAGSTIVVRILVNGLEADSFDFALEDPAPIVGEPGQQVLELLDRLPGLLAAVRPALDNYLDALGATGDERAVLEALLLLAEQEYETARPQIGEAFALLDDETLRRIHQVANANGLADAIATLEALNGPQVQGLSQLQGGAGESVLELLCSMPRIKDAFEKIDGVMGWVSNFVQLCALVPSPAQPVCAALVPACAAFGTVSDVATMIINLSPKPDPALLVTAEPASLEAGEQAQLRTFVRLRGAEALCVTGAAQLRKMLQTKLALRMFSKVGGVKLAAKILEKYPLDQRGDLREKVLEQLRDTLDFLVGKALDLLQVNALLDSLQTKICAYVQGLAGPGSFTVALQNSNFLPPDPQDIGTLVPSAVGSTDPAIFTCQPPDDESHTVTISVDRAGCDVSQRFTGSVKIECSSAKSDVEITIGDNGSALDDIYEVQIDGVTVLTSSVPVTSISTTVPLARGQHTLLLIGRAAPDFIGTYFMQIEGATILSGPPLSGTNLTAGTVFTYVIQVGL